MEAPRERERRRVALPPRRSPPPRTSSSLPQKTYPRARRAAHKQQRRRLARVHLHLHLAPLARVVRAPGRRTAPSRRGARASSSGPGGGAARRGERGDERRVRAPRRDRRVDPRQDARVASSGAAAAPAAASAASAGSFQKASVFSASPPSDRGEATSDGEARGRRRWPIVDGAALGRPRVAPVRQELQRALAPAAGHARADGGEEGGTSTARGRRRPPSRRVAPKPGPPARARRAARERGLLLQRLFAFRGGACPSPSGRRRARCRSASRGGCRPDLRTHLSKMRQR